MEWIEGVKREKCEMSVSFAEAEYALNVDQAHSLLAVPLPNCNFLLILW